MSQFDTREWHAAVAAVVEADNGDGIAGRLIEAITQVVGHDGTCLLAFHRDARPEVLHHTLEPAGARHYVERYLSGPYLLDPLYELALRDDRPKLCRFREASPRRNTTARQRSLRSGWLQGTGKARCQMHRSCPGSAAERLTKLAPNGLQHGFRAATD